MGFKEVLIIGFLVVTAFFIGQGFGEQFGVLQQAESFTERFPSQASCDWNETGTLVNAEVNPDCGLQIQDTATAASTITVQRLPLLTNEEDFTEEAYATNNVEYLNNSLGDYFTGTNNGFSYYTSNKYLQAAPLTVEYRYEQISDPTTAELVLWDETNNNEEDSVSLTPGDETQDFKETATLTPSNEGQYSLRVEFTGATDDEQRVYSLESYQSSDELTNIGYGYYESETLFTSDDTVMERIEAQGDNIQRGNNNPKQFADVDIYGYTSGQQVASTTIEAGNDIVVEEDLFSNTTVEEYRFDVRLVTETGTSPELDNLVFSGTTSDRVASQEVSELLGNVFIFMILGMALLYGAAQLG